MYTTSFEGLGMSATYAGTALSHQKIQVEYHLYAGTLFDVKAA
jgi:hypothetical protein